MPEEKIKDAFLSCFTANNKVLKLDVQKWNEKQRDVLDQTEESVLSFKSVSFLQEYGEIEEIDCCGATFLTNILIDSCFFSQKINLTNCKFEAGFAACNTVFGRTVDLSGSRFHKDAFFVTNLFASQAKFIEVHFSKGAYLYSNLFMGLARFYATRFSSFATFRNYRTFMQNFPLEFSPENFYPQEFGCEFYSDARFQSVFDSELNVAGVKFHVAPSFHFAEFGSAPLIQNIQVSTKLPESKELAKLARARILKFCKNREDGSREFLADWHDCGFDTDRAAIQNELTERFRSLKLIAFNTSSHLQALKFRSGEIISNRYIYRKHRRTDLQDKLNTSVSASEHYLGVLYGILSNFGMSFLKPIGLLIILFVIVGFLFWCLSAGFGLIDGDHCKEVSDQILLAYGLILEKTFLGC